MKMHVGELRENVSLDPGQIRRAPSPRLVRAAHEFEGQMMKELLRPFTDRDVLTGAEDASDSGSGQGEVLCEFASEALGQALSAHGGLGLADWMVKSLSGGSDQHRGPAGSGNLHRNTEIRATK